jgi:hypothetical protein
MSSVYELLINSLELILSLHRLSIDIVNLRIGFKEYHKEVLSTEFSFFENMSSGLIESNVRFETDFGGDSTLE